MSIFVTTSRDSGWDCVGGVYEADSEEQILEHIAKERGMSIEEIDDIIIHEVFEVTKIN